ncbi:SDR family oxidoreductase [Pelagibacterium luteolum]|uniref:NAD(P)-dependent dehydrogenase, short-chain alcohol dehydrogenase family n=1 Tax=Pelagibacterium luteolum TaxID=440168 RepID=A0A1G7STF0_9HYPH|nr:SDR family oxidoreductase [Pelagibacterium luteolum]SDG26064.1 NAD(P)-dependent dehydrogenase, short-chain alcohol dehydrogenase family [Pelagibacterium luteolum]
MTKWTTANIPSQSGRTAVVTGTGGIGYEDALALAGAGANVVLAGRNAKKGAEAVARIKASHPRASVRFGLLDLGDLASVARFAEQLAAEQPHLDILINNAGVMTPPERRTTSDGFELQLGTNYLGHFALTAHLMPLLKKGTNPRVITLGSVAARSGAIDFSDLQAERSYDAMKVYSQSKLACIMFAFELARRSRAAGWGIESMGAHPGISRTDLIPNQAARWSFAGLTRRMLPFLFQPASQGALPTLYAATDPNARDGAYYGPDRLGGTRGYPTQETPPPQALDSAKASQLWDVSEALVGIRFA